MHKKQRKNKAKRIAIRKAWDKTNNKQEKVPKKISLFKKIKIKAKSFWQNICRKNNKTKQSICLFAVKIKMKIILQFLHVVFKIQRKLYKERKFHATPLLST